MIVRLAKVIFQYLAKSFWRNAGLSRGLIRFGKALLTKKGFKIAIQKWVQRWAVDNIPVYRYYQQYKMGELLQSRGMNTSGVQRVFKQLIINKLTPIELRKIYYLYDDVKHLRKSLNDQIKDYKKMRNPQTKLEKLMLNREIEQIQKGISIKDVKKEAENFFKLNAKTLEKGDNGSRAEFLEKWQHSLSTKEMKHFLEKINSDITFIPTSPQTQNFNYVYTYNTKREELICQVRGGFITGDETDRELQAKIMIADKCGWNPKTIIKQDVEINIIIKALRTSDFGVEIWHGMGLKNY